MLRVAFIYLNNECNVGRGAGYVAASVMRAGHSLTFFDTCHTPLDVVADRVSTGRYDLLMLSSMTMLFPEAIELARKVKARRPIPVLLGGVHPTIEGGALLEQHPELDYLCMGEGESAVADVLRNWGRPGLQQVENLVWRDGTKVRANPVRCAEDLSALPAFPWHFFPDEAVVQGGQGFLYVHATRGCPFNCTYCCNQAYLDLYGGEYIRFRPATEVVAELDMLQRCYRPKLFYFGDEMILSKPAYATELFESIKNELCVPYGCMARVEYMRPETVDLLRRTGCCYLGMGVECGDETFRREKLKRRMSNSQIEHAFDLVREAGIFATSFNMIGYPFVYDEKLTQASVALNERLKPNFVQWSIFYPFPGTELAAYCKEKDLVDPKKVQGTRHYFEDSVLRGRSLKRVRADLERQFNPHGFKIEIPAANPPRKAVSLVPAKENLRIPHVLMIAADHLIIDRRILQEARGLVKAGYEVDVVSGFECAQEEHYETEGVRVHRYNVWHLPDPVPPPPPSGRLGRLPGWGLLHMVRARLGLVRPPVHTTIRKICSRFHADIVHVHDLPMLETGFELAEEFGARLVYDSHEIYHVHHSIPWLLKRKMRRDEARLMRQTDLFITVNEQIAEYFAAAYGIQPLVLYNSVETPTAEQLAGAHSRLRERAGLPPTARVVLYQGWFSPERNLLSLVNAAQYLNDGTWIVLIGYGEYEKVLRDALKGQSYADRVKFLGRVESEEMLALTAGADLGVIPYQAVDLNHQYCSPNKFFEFVQTGVPVLAQTLPFFTRMARDHGVVATADLSSSRQMGAAIQGLLSEPNRLEQMRSACVKASSVLNWEAENRKLLGAYARLTAKGV